MTFLIPTGVAGGVPILGLDLPLFNSRESTVLFTGRKGCISLPMVRLRFLLHKEVRPYDKVLILSYTVASRLITSLVTVDPSNVGRGKIEAVRRAGLGDISALLRDSAPPELKTN
jgi:hypothetical protein